MKPHAIITTLLLLLCVFACVDDSKTKNIDKKDGINEHYTGTEREAWQNPALVIDLFGDLSNKVVAEIGAGIGFFATRLCKNAKKVIAIDINEDLLKDLDLIARKDGLRLETRLGEVDDPLLQDEEVDAVLIVNTYVYFDDHIGYLKTLIKGMKPGGRLVIVDSKKRNTPIGPDKGIRVPLYEVEQHLKTAGFSVKESNDTALKYQYIVVADKPLRN